MSKILQISRKEMEKIYLKKKKLILNSADKTFTVFPDKFA